jgi:hypothetical protein
MGALMIQIPSLVIDSRFDHVSRDLDHADKAGGER